MVRNRRRIDFEGKLTEVGEPCQYAALSIGATREKGKVCFAGAAEPSSKEKIPITELA
jgi:hypothetical protein